MTRAQENILPFTSNGSHFSYMPMGEHAPRPPPPTFQASDFQASANKKSSFDFLSRVEQKLAQYNASESILKRWLFEILSVVTSAACMGAIIGILCYIDDRSLNKWPSGLTIITVLSKIASAALILPISEAIGQLKWTWFNGKKSRDAFDFEIFDKASRGAWGSFMLLCRTKGKSLAALGALLTVFLLAIDTFFQQVTDLPERWIVQGESSIPRSIRYEPRVDGQFDSTWDTTEVAQLNPDLRRAMYPFFYDNGTQPTVVGNTTQAEIPLVCPTSRCEWPSYETLAVCSACEDVSHMLEYACLRMKMDWIRNSTGPGTDSTWPNGTACGYFLNATSNNPVLMSGFRLENGTIGETLLMRTLPLATNPDMKPLYGGSINFKHIQYPILDALIVSSLNGSVDNVYNKKLPVAQECVFSFCVKTLHSSYDSGGYREDLEKTFFNSTSTTWPWDVEYADDMGGTLIDFKSDIHILPPAPNGTSNDFGIKNTTFVDFVSVLEEMFPSMITVLNATAPPFIKIRTSFTTQVMYRSVSYSPWLSPNNITRHIQRMAQAMTNVMRSDAHSNKLIIGTAFARETYIAVHWPWMTFPLLMLLLSIVFLVATMYKTSRDNEIGVWKTSAMPTLMYGLPKHTQNDIMSSAVSRGIYRRGSRRVRIRLLPKQGWRVSGQMIARPAPPPGFF
ncbi:hypothetical protein COCC4DRAFT_191454 [Bipolaris maydis ATCC 48331]|uniref:DUF3176 domain containing protein n=3 Tax=cellular organisms TaxID=131567 RepID=M2V0K6_COCH5|nr:uncharacterized protein COCC4DRAFT_191454 [Bipolaris maydis ATCC 48331]EMD93578.1 hypothetical protein COCHEDRAFT_1192884 [Bipolaris maydis C5]KAJ5027888.1 hypothetical protein J3E73DRAFT_430755 [Bipolaris maydis]ENI06973.1 hypothetical protein COCC4DRAFT_191454 [Bipolaris maydis ATCC 48331]KAJ6204821.1 hypothetical protein PSV09DRAFT_1192884 [Bipolaris maydis]KAJ6266475.1 hypothetical protein PSV08DRAFT_412250 [Bipolaris maydis]